MSMVINGRKVGSDAPPYVIAELSANHNGDLTKAFQTIDAAAAAGADAVKIQTYTADTMTIDCDTQDFMIRGGLWNGYKLYDLYKWAETPYEWHRDLFGYAKKKGITIFSTPFDETAVDLLESLNTPVYKVASFEMTDLPLLKYIGRTGKPVIMSTGMASLDEIAESLEALKSSGSGNIILLHCISSYPAPMDQANLRQIQTLRKLFGVETGLSDHTLGTTASVAAIALGACMVEKHFTLSRDDKGPDSEFSIEPAELASLCHATKDAWLALGSLDFSRQEAEKDSMRFRRSVYFVRDLAAGDTVTEADVRRIRPGFGLAPKYFQDVLGRRMKVAVSRGTPVSWDVLDD